MLVRIVSMLCKLVDMFSAPSGVREEAEEYKIDDDEDDDENDGRATGCREAL